MITTRPMKINKYKFDANQSGSKLLGSCPMDMYVQYIEKIIDNKSVS